jgi:molybdenum cofactor cytidylyltransferase
VAARDVVVLPEGGPDQVLWGMGYSIAVGVSARPDASGWLILPADMPLVQTATLQAVARQLEHHPVVYAQHKGRRGHPVGFSAELYSELAVLTGDEGARRLVARYPALGVEVDDPGVLIDVDTEDDLERLRNAPLEPVKATLRR